MKQNIGRQFVEFFAIVNVGSDSDFLTVEDADDDIDETFPSELGICQGRERRDIGMGMEEADDF